MNKIAIWNFDVSTAMTFGSRFVDAPPPFPNFVYEPWHSARIMLREFLHHSQACCGFVAVVGPDWAGVAAQFEPCANPEDILRWIREDKMAPSGWLEWERGMNGSLEMAQRALRDNADADIQLYVVNRGPIMDDEIALTDDFIYRARGLGVKVNVVPMGNEPGRWYFPNLHDLTRLAQATGGKVYYHQAEDVYDFSHLPQLASEMIVDFWNG